jgi:hypothetical protein
MTYQEKILSIGERLENDEDVSYDECLEYLSAFTGISKETLEARAYKISGQELLSSEGI